jgi:ATP-dependent Clp protease ATP-binding subunit ClpC
MMKTTARLMLLAFTLNTIMPSGALAAARSVELPSAPLALPAAAVAPVVPLSAVSAPSLAAPSLTPVAPAAPVASPAAAPQAAAAGPKAGAPAAMPNLQRAAQLSQSVARPGATSGAVKEESARVFDAAAKGAVAAPEAAADAAADAARTAQNVAAARLAHASAPKSKAAARVKSWVPKALAAAGVVGAAAVAHFTGHHELAMTALPMMMLGTVQDAAGPKDQKLLEHLRAHASPGQAVTPRLLTEAAEELGMSQVDAYQAVGRLGAQGHFALLSNGHSILLKLGQGSSDVQTQAALRSAREALPLLNSDNTTDHLKAVALLQGAFQTLRKHVENTPRLDASQQSALSQLRVLTLNAALEVQRDAVVDFDDRLEAPEVLPETKHHARHTAKEVNGWLYTNVPDTLRSMTRPSAQVHAALLEMLRHYNPSTDPVAQRGLTIARQLAEGLTPAKAAASHDDDEARNPQRRPLLAAPSSGSSASAAAPADGKWRSLTNGDGYETLRKYGSNITQLAADGKLKALIGREKELKQIVKTLLRDEKNNPIVVGEAGVGKTAIVEGLAQRIVAGDVPEELRGKNIIQLSLTKLIAGTKYRGEFEERVQNILSEVRASNGQIIIFIDEIHKILGAGGAEGATDLSQMLLENLGRGGLSVIGATTLDKYRKIEKDSALNRRFNGVLLQPPSQAEAVEILNSRKARYEKKHGVTISEETVKAAVHLASRFITDRQLPDSALDLLDDASTEVQLRASEAKAKGQPEVREVTKDDIGTEIALRLDVPAANMTGDEREKLKNLPERLKTRVIGQDEAVDSVVRAVRRSKLGYKDPNQPDMFVFVGPTGVGKTELVKALALEEFGSKTAMTRIDMSEYAEKHNVARLIGAPPGYVGYEQGGALTEAVRRKPYQIILLDEIDKAHPDVWNLLLQIKDDGRLTDGNGRVVDFRNVIIVATANYKGQHSQDKTEEKRNPIGFIPPRKEEPAADKPEDEKAGRKKQYVEDFRAAVRPEMFNRIGERNVVPFNELTSGDYAKIAGLREADLNQRLAHKNMKVTLTENAVKQILLDADTPENRRYGARPLKQTVEDEVVEALVEADLDGRIGDGDAVTVDYDFAAGTWVVAKAK